jgi:hypothetical protein
MHAVLSVEESGVDPQAKGRLLDAPLDRVAVVIGAGMGGLASTVERDSK